RDVELRRAQGRRRRRDRRGHVRVREGGAERLAARRAAHGARGGLMRALVIGGGTMGRGIAQLLALHGNDVALADTGEASTQAALEGAAASLARAAERGRISAEEALAATALITPDDGSMEPEIAIEAVFEDLALKRE